MADEDEQLRVRVAWLYFMEGLTQADIAARLGITRLRANRLLGEARESGLVTIRVNSPLAGCVELERELVRGAGLKDAVVVPTPDDPEQVTAAIGRATAEYLARHLGENRVRGIGVGWGATLRETIRHLRSANLSELSVNSMMGGLTHGLELNTFEIAGEFARRINGQCNYLAAPIYAGSPRSRDTILEQDVFRETFQRLATNDVALMSVGDLSRRSLLIRYGLPRDVTVESLRACGAVGDIMGTFLDASGKPVKHAVNRRVIALPVDRLRDIATVIVASGGLNKTAILAAALRARLCSVVVVDEATARAVLGVLRGG
ncbi:MAG: sugar-binding transcriptional regulator [Alphaproteobacteria bacterium]|nr:sugar-binding transcriptional regulator [Alphaproteobacteria bacterium]